MTPEQKPGKDTHLGVQGNPERIGDIAQQLYGDQISAASLNPQDRLLELIRRRNGGEHVDDEAMLDAIQAADDEIFRQRER